MTFGDLAAQRRRGRRVAGKSVQFVEAPTVPYPPNLNWVEFAQPQDRKLFRAIAHDANLPNTAPKATTGQPPSVLASSASPSQVKVEVLNGSGATAKASQIGSGLASRGFHVTKTGNAPDNRVRTVVEYGAASQRPKANAVAGQIPGARVKQVASLASGPVVVIVGSRDNSLTPKPKPSPGHKVAGLSAKYGGITGTANCRSDTGAFAGPLSP